MFHHRRQLRRWAARVLMLWLFGIGAGVANGCLAAGGAMSGGPTAAHAAAVVGAHPHAAGTAGDGHHQALQAPYPAECDHQGTPAKRNCQDFCDKTSMSIPPLKAALDHADGPALAPREIAMAGAYGASTFDRSRAARRDGAPAPPITIAFLRLAL
jgi:hypothetical protein